MVWTYYYQVNPLQSELREQEMYIFEQVYFNREQ